MPDQPINIFLLMGQSNMVGLGQADEVEPIEHPDILMFRHNQWVRARESLHSEALAGTGLGMSFALELVRAYASARIGLVACAMGGSPLNEWVKGGDLYENALKNARSAREHGVIKGVLWHQGESDSGNKELAESYFQRFTGMVEALKDDLGMTDLPVIIGQLGEFIAACGEPRPEGRDTTADLKYCQVVNDALKKAGQTLPLGGWVSSRGLKDTGDRVHFNAPALREFGRRYAQEYQKVLKNQGLTLLAQSG